MFTKVLYTLALLGLFTSYLKDKDKTKLALKKSWKSFSSILPSILSILLLIGIILAVLNKDIISSLLGEQSGIFGILIAAIIGCITLIPGFVAFPLAASLLSSGAGYTQIAVFLSTLMMVGFATLPLESRYFGKRIAVKRNILAFVLAVIVSLVIGVIMS